MLRWQSYNLRTDSYWRKTKHAIRFLMFGGSLTTVALSIHSTWPQTQHGDIHQVWRRWCWHGSWGWQTGRTQCLTTGFCAMPHKQKIGYRKFFCDDIIPDILYSQDCNHLVYYVWGALYNIKNELKASIYKFKPGDSG